MLNNSGSLVQSSTLLSILPKKPWCSFDKKLRFVLPSALAIEKPYIQLNHPVCAWAFCIDLDTETEEPCFPWEEAGLPAPTYAVWNPENGHCHLIWILDAPCFARSHDGWRLRRIAEGFCNALSADKAFVYQIQLVKNPLHEKWKTYETAHVYTLDCLDEAAAEHLVQPGKQKKTKEEMQLIAMEGRNCGLFDVVRKEAYGMVRTCKTENELREKTTAVLRLFNSALERPFAIGESDMRSIPKSIAKWTWKKRSLFEKAGHSSSNAGLEAPEVSRNARGNHQRRKGWLTRERLFKAYREMQNEGKKITAAGLSRRAGVHRNIAQKYLKDLFLYSPKKCTS